jgi:polysaccharide biosynthesis/export protein
MDSVFSLIAGRLSSLLLIVVAVGLSAQPAHAEYRINVGDVVQISVTGLPDFHQSAQVDLDGNISVPLGGNIHAADRPLSDLRAEIQKMLATKVYRQTTRDGHENQIAIKAPEINVTIAQYRPVYVSGDVAKPGEQAYRPGMIVRQAVALAGGYDLLHLRMENPFLESADFQSEYERLRTDIVKAQAHIARIRSELAALDSAPASKPRDKQADHKTDDDDQAGLSNVKTYAPVDDQIVLSEGERLAADQKNFANEKSFLNTLADEVAAQLATLEKQAAEEQEGSRMDSQNLTKMEDYYQKGTLPLMRYTEERRTVLLSSTRALQTVAEVDKLRRDRAEIARRIQNLSEQRKLALVGELQNAQVDLAAARSKLRAAGEKLLYTGSVKSQLTRGPGGKPQIVVFRTQKTGPVRIDAADDTELLPGDVIEVTLHLDYPIAGTPPAEAAR